MSEPVSNAHQVIEKTLVCFKCHMTNLLGASAYVTCDLRAGTADCSVCGASGPLAKFQPTPRSEGD